ncbi:CTD kinase subunit 3 [Amniculicola lignicola CBS 123094]|uniref:CTD kinase subunit 3 n=1 Tax=Amniculicola lignicola CBS 123094 TaxID=1392246 RepID=A0A6A5WR64_9PLEO|nr:CTD kinase subunit 3 [Amniculicola lignicola CBS 123094]
MDPFEVRMRFSTQLHGLTASQTSVQKAANFALKNRELDEDLHSCIIEQLERNSMNNRANILYFIDHLSDLSLREKHLKYIHLIQRDILRIIDAAVPDDGSGAANIKVVRRVLTSLQGKKVLQPQTVSELEQVLQSRDVTGTTGAGVPGDATMEGVESTSGAGGAAGAGTRTWEGGPRLEKGLIMQRIEEDRERHKRSRESIWMVSGEDAAEAEQIWNEGAPLGEDDELVGQEDCEERMAMLS